MSRATRPLVLVGIIALLAGIAVLVARPRPDPPAVAPYAGPRGASLVKAAGLVPYWRRELETRPLVPGTKLRAGDVVQFKVRTDRPRFLEVRDRDRVLFPSGPTAQEVKSGEALPVTLTLDGSPRKEVITALFGDYPFPVGAPPAADLLPVTIEIEKEAVAGP